MVDSNQLQKEIILFTTVSFPQKTGCQTSGRNVKHNKSRSIKPVMPQLNFVHGVSSAFFSSVFNFSCLHRIAWHLVRFFFIVCLFSLQEITPPSQNNLIQLKTPFPRTINPVIVTMFFVAKMQLLWHVRRHKLYDKMGLDPYLLTLGTQEKNLNCKTTAEDCAGKGLRSIAQLKNEFKTSGKV